MEEFRGFGGIGKILSGFQINQEVTVICNADKPALKIMVSQLLCKALTGW